MAIDEKQAADNSARVFLSARAVISTAVAFLQRESAVVSATSEDSTSFSAALQDAIFEIDAQPELVDPFLDTFLGSDAANIVESGAAQAFSMGSLQVPRKQGKLQAIRSLKVALFGGLITVEEDGQTRTDTFGGILESLKAAVDAAGDDLA